MRGVHLRRLLVQRLIVGPLRSVKLFELAFIEKQRTVVTKQANDYRISPAHLFPAMESGLNTAKLASGSLTHKPVGSYWRLALAVRARFRPRQNRTGSSKIHLQGVFAPPAPSDTLTLRASATLSTHLLGRAVFPDEDA